jgi:hypothetical protein
LEENILRDEKGIGFNLKKREKKKKTDYAKG